MLLIVKPNAIIILLAGMILCLLVAHIAGQVSVYYFGFNSDMQLVRLFDLDREVNVPTLFSTVILLLSSLCFVAIACAKKIVQNRYFFHWAGLALLFLFLSADEALSFHETLIRPLQRVLGTSGVFHFAWVVPYGIGVIILALLYLKFLIHLPKKPRVLITLAGLIYVSGALGFEMIAGPVVEWYAAGSSLQSYSSARSKNSWRW